jgi:Leucine-rich repeat (LRR) protein
VSKIIFSAFIATVMFLPYCSSSHTDLGISINSDSVYYASTRNLKSNKIPDSVFNMLNLKSIHIAGMDCDMGLHNDITPNDNINCWMVKEIPSEIKNLVLLDTLEISLATFDELPDEISTLKNLRYISLTDCNISNIDNLTLLTNLNQLLLYGDRVEHLPMNIGNLKNLKFLGLRGNLIHKAELERVKRALPNCTVYY